MKRIVLAGVLLVMSTLGMASGPIKDDSPTKYTVASGDTLWDISTTFLESPWLWPEIWHANPQIQNPHLIFPGDVISLVYVDGKPRLMISSRGDTGRTIKLSPKVRVLPGESAIPAIPLGAIKSYLKGGYVFASEEEFEQSPYVFYGEDSKTTAATGDKVYARGDFTADNVSRFSAVRRGDMIEDPQTGELLGIVGLDIGTANLHQVQGDVASIIIQSSKLEMRNGDRLVDQESSGLVTTFFPKSPEVPVEATVTANLNGSKKISKHDTIIINKGGREQLEQGDVFAIYRPDEKVLDPFSGEKVSLPLERVGYVMVYRPFEKMSYGIVLMAEEDLEVGYILKSPQP
ncbi:LysM peptidoglycan-binding domain-containing protein [uncultured Endozoicomonas sp.]|uniref:LysM peptidoglycan-binding domain-containing protein n=1 Tax=uncultured Endozoicomonas sp. TaxID=432652 RepID=UPI002612EE34|nr:LysM peptidoglycan-binding domain-containing protein [uncultured Endozoicomonas sp.]